MEIHSHSKWLNTTPPNPQFSRGSSSEPVQISDPSRSGPSKKDPYTPTTLPKTVNPRSRCPTSSKSDSQGPQGPPPCADKSGGCRPDDVVIAVMGVTGVGKSTFISHFSKTAVVGDGVKSCEAPSLRANHARCNLLTNTLLSCPTRHRYRSCSHRLPRRTARLSNRYARVR